MIAVAIAIAAVSLAALGLIGWLVHQVVGAKNEASRQREVAEQNEDRADEQEQRAERAEFELEIHKGKLSEVQATLDALEKEWSDAISTSSLGDGLADDDVVGRMLRLQARRRAEAGDSLPPSTSDAVPEDVATEPTSPSRLRDDPDGLEVP